MNRSIVYQKHYRNSTFNNGFGSRPLIGSYNQYSLLFPHTSDDVCYFYPALLSEASAYIHTVWNRNLTDICYSYQLIKTWCFSKGLKRPIYTTWYVLKTTLKEGGTRELGGAHTKKNVAFPPLRADSSFGYTHMIWKQKRGSLGGRMGPSGKGGGVSEGNGWWIWAKYNENISEIHYLLC